MKKKFLLLIIFLSLFLGIVKAEEPEIVEDPTLITENIINEEEQVEESPVEKPVEEEPVEEKESKLENQNENQKENYLGPIVLVFLVLLFLMFSFRNQAKNSKEINKR